MSNTAIPSGLTKLAEVESATIIGSSIMLNPSILQVVAQASGFNYELKISVEDLGASEVIPEYLNYYIIEIKTGPDWPKHAGLGPVIPPTHLGMGVYKTGSKGIAVVGSNQTINLDVSPPGMPTS